MLMDQTKTPISTMWQSTKQTMAICYSYWDSSELTTRQQNTLTSMESLGTYRTYLGWCLMQRRCAWSARDGLRTTQEVLTLAPMPLQKSPSFLCVRQQRMFVPGVEFEFLFRRSPTTTFLNGANVEVATRKIRIHNAKLKVCRWPWGFLRFADCCCSQFGCLIVKLSEVLRYRLRFESKICIT